jgi:hypothetical protein
MARFNPKQRRERQVDSKRAEKGQPATKSAILGQLGPW